MKYILILILLSTSSLDTIAQESKKEQKNKEKDEKYKLILDLIQSGEFEFIGLRAAPRKGQQIDLQSRPNYMRISNGKATADLPYFGVAQNPGYGGDGGVYFDATPINYQVEENDKKRKINVKFRMKEKMETYDCLLTVNSAENVTLSITSSRRSSITYYGSVTEYMKGE